MPTPNATSEPVEGVDAACTPVDDVVVLDATCEVVDAAAVELVVVDELVVFSELLLELDAADEEELDFELVEALLLAVVTGQSSLSPSLTPPGSSLFSQLVVPDVV